MEGGKEKGKTEGGEKKEGRKGEGRWMREGKEDGRKEGWMEELANAKWPMPKGQGQMVNA